jgi:hypothetical protein
MLTMRWAPQWMPRLIKVVRRQMTSVQTLESQHQHQSRCRRENQSQKSR